MSVYEAFISVFYFSYLPPLVMINIFLRADEIEMVMTDLERANQVRHLIRWHILNQSYPKLAVTATETKNV